MGPRLKERTMSNPPSARTFVLLFTAAAAALWGCAEDPSSDAGEPVGETHVSFDDWKASLPRDPRDGAYLVDGNTRVQGDDALRAYYAEHSQPDALIVNKRDDGSDDRWGDAQKLNLTYCVSPAFGDRYRDVVTAMRSAASDWAQAAAVRFVYHGEEDGECTAANGNVLFEVVPAYDTHYNAKSFFPSLAERGEHQLFVDLGNVERAAPKTLTGVLRHELGHVLGFRHEHVRPEGNGQCTEGPDWRALTPYDPDSVMHYNAESRCRGANEGDYELSPLDRAGAASLYGPPR
jgi:hypothetical protein